MARCLVESFHAERRLPLGHVPRWRVSDGGEFFFSAFPGGECKMKEFVYLSGKNSPLNKWILRSQNKFNLEKVN